MRENTGGLLEKLLEMGRNQELELNQVGVGEIPDFDELLEVFGGIGKLF